MAVLRLLSVALAIAGIAAWALVARRQHRLGAYAPAFVLWLLHAGVFSAVVLLTPDYVAQHAQAFNMWSMIVRLQIIITLVAMGVLAYHDRGR